MTNKPRKPWVAGLLTFFTIGLGHLYFGKIQRGISLFFVGLFLGIFTLLTVLLNISAGLIIVAVFFLSYKTDFMHR